MNSNQLEQLLLLEQSGELSPSQRRALDAELAASPETRRFRDQLRALAAAAPAPAAGPAPDAAARITARLAPRPRMVVWKPLLATAAALALLLSVYTFRPDPASAPIETAGDDEVYVGRVRTDPTVANGLSLWIASDNLRKGAALNAVQIAEALIAEHLKKRIA